MRTSLLDHARRPVPSSPGLTPDGRWLVLAPYHLDIDDLGEPLLWLPLAAEATVQARTPRSARPDGVVLEADGAPGYARSATVSR